MTLFVDILLAALGFLGHFALWVAIFNRIHATGVSCRTIKTLEKFIAAIIVIIPTLFAIRMWLEGFRIYDHFNDATFWTPLGYLIPCWLAGIAVPPLWLWRKLTTQKPAQFLSCKGRVEDVVAALGHRPVGSMVGRIADKIPGNGIFFVEVNEKEFALPGLPPELDGYTITHISDLHFHGALEKEFFEHCVQLANQQQSDMVAVTGDIVDKEKCIAWIPDTLGKLTARDGVYYVLGNHDKRLCDIQPLLDTLKDSGLIHVGGRCMNIQCGETPVLLAGNEMPWFPAVTDDDLSEDKEPAPRFRMLMAHTPDQFGWAVARKFDLMLAGHNHGGQIRAPLYGPIVSPSYYGVRYASGVFFKDQTLLHVSRGISGLQPLRISCPPEITRIVLRCGSDER